MDIEEIMAVLPHRYPFLMVDRVTEFDPEGSAVAVKNITVNEPFFQGHFPGSPVFPGVLMVEAFAQLGGLWAYLAGVKEVATKSVFFVSVDKVKFRRVVTPGDALVLKVSLLHRRRSVYKFRGEAFVRDKLAAEGEVTMAIDIEGPDRKGLAVRQS